MLSLALGCRLRSNMEDLLIARLDLFALLLGAGGVFLHQLDVGERLAARLLLDLRMQRTQAADIDDDLLRFRREAIVLEQLAPRWDWARALKMPFGPMMNGVPSVG